MTILAPVSPADILIAAASDIAPLERSLSQAFEQASGQRVRFAFGASGMLARQIEHGAPYDLYLSANEQFVRNLVRSGRILPDSVRVYALGRLAIWSKKGNIRKLEDLPRLGQISIANPAHAPYGMAAREALERSGLWKALSGKIVYGENVRQAYQFAESGNAQAALTAWSLVFDKGGVLVPAELHNPVRQTGGVVKSSKQPERARALLQFLGTAAGRKLLSEHGLAPPGN